MSISNRLDPKSTYSLELFYSSIKTIEMGIGVDFKMLVTNLSYVVGSLITSLFINWSLTLILLCITPFIAGVSTIFIKVWIVFSYSKGLDILADHEE